MQKSFTQFLLGLSVLILCGACGSDSVGDAANRQRDRDLLTADMNFKEYSKINGVYVAGNDHFQVTLNLQAARAGSGGYNNNVPEPTIMGDMIVRPNLVSNAADSDVEKVYQITNGTYTAAGGDFSASVVAEDTTPLHCTGDTGNPDALHCTWYSVREVQKLEFTRQKPADFKAAGSPDFGDYAGSDANYTIVAEIRSDLANRGGSLPQPTVVGRFIFTPKQKRVPGPPVKVEFPFTGGGFDPYTGTLVMNVQGSGPDILVNCMLTSAQNLHCKWHARQFEEFDLKRESKPDQREHRLSAR